ncbi:MAG: ATP-binding protein [Desulfobulbus sp.]|nr:ATP-binding protein [Desulfobulbus sp.]
MSIPVKVALVIISIVVVFTVALTGTSILLTQNSLEEMTRNDLRAVVEIAGDFFGTKITLLKADAETVAAKLANAPPNKLPEVFQQVRNHYPDFLAFKIFNRQGIVTTWGNPPMLVEYNMVANKYFRKAFQGETVITRPRKDPKTGDMVIHLCTPINDDLILSVTINGLVFQDMLSSFKLWHRGKIFMVDEFGTVIASPKLEHVLGRYDIHNPDPDLGQIKWNDTFAKAIQTKAGVTEYADPDMEALIAWQTMTERTEGWVVGVFAPLQDSPVAEGKKMLLLAAAIFLGICIVAAFFFSSYAARPFILIEKQNQSLKELNEVIVAADEAKTHFLANMSHEMRTPLNAVIGLTELMLHTEHDHPSGHIENLQKVFNAGSTLLSIINDILDLSKVSSGNFEIAPVDYNLSILLHDVVNQNMIRIGSKPIQLKLWVDPSIPNRLFGDDLRIRQILNNLLSNAFKYTRAGTVSLNVSCEQKESDDVWLFFTIQDTGTGIRAEDVENIFNDYYQVDTKANRKIEGTGLGLPLTKRLVEMMGGSITVESTYGQGSTFQAQIRQKAVSEQPIGKEIADSLANFNFATVQVRHNKKLSRIYLPYAKVLVVDDVPTNLDVAQGLMEPYGMQIDCVESGQAAIDLIREARVQYNVVFMDHMMLEMDGVEAVRVIRKEIDSDYARTVPIIALTANAVVGSKEMFLQHGFQGFISKPINVMQLDSVIRRWIQDEQSDPEQAPRSAVLHLDTELPAPTTDRLDAPDTVFDPEMKVKATPVWTAGEIDGLNVTQGLATFSGNMKSYLRIVESYVHHTPAQLAKIRAVTPETLLNYSITVHGIKGSSRTLGAEDVGDLAETLEQAAKAGDFAFVQAHNPLFLETTERLLAALSAKLKASVNPKPHRDEPDPEMLETLCQACAIFDIDWMDQTMQSLTSYTYNPGEGAELVAWLEEKAHLLDFKGIAERLTKNRSL